MQSMDDIYRRYARTVFRYLMAKVHNEDLAEELTQETFYQAIRSIERFDGSCSLSTWLCAIARNQLYNYQRRNPAMTSLDERLSPKGSEGSWGGDRSSKTGSISEYNEKNIPSASSAEAETLASLERVELMKQLHVCPEPYREILYLRIFGNLSFREIGEILGKTENWARVTYYRGKEKLRKGMEDHE